MSDNGYYLDPSSKLPRDGSVPADDGFEMIVGGDQIGTKPNIFSGDGSVRADGNIPADDD